ncbi:MAG: DUF2079 domain-containing protein [Lachnospiraceae bacterium]|nr:DUF2079 domain-containing protein [Lachnospiraceae bacterium]
MKGNSEIKTYELWGFRLFLAWCITAMLFMLINTENDIFYISYVTHVETKAFVFIFLLVVVVLTNANVLLKRWYTDVVLCLFVVPLYTTFMVINKASIYMCLAIFIFVFILAGYTFKRFAKYTDNVKIGNLTSKVIVMMVLILWMAYLMMLTLIRYLSLKSPCYDFGIFSQMYYYMKDCLIPYTTCERNMLLSHLDVHMSPILYILLPIYCIFPSPATILVSQVLLLAGAVVPLYLICKEKKLSNLFTTVICVVYLLYPTMSGGLFYDFHENKFLPLVIFWFIYFMEKRKLIPSVICMILVCGVKEDAAVYAGCVALYYIFAYKMKKEKVRAIIMFTFIMLYFIFVVKYLGEMGDGAMTGRFGAFLANKDDSIFSMVVNIIKNPTYFFANIMQEEKAEFLLWTMIPLCFVPVLGRKMVNYILILPYLLLHFITSYLYQYNIYYQYGYGSMSLLLFMVILYFAENDSGKKQHRRNVFLAFMMVFGVMITFTSSITAKHYYIINYTYEEEKSDLIRKTLEETIPEDASVEASSYFVVPLSDRHNIYQIGTKNRCEYVVYDLRISGDQPKIEEYQKEKLADGYEIIQEIEGLVRILKLKQ